MQTQLQASRRGRTFRVAFEELRHERFDERAQKLTKSFRPYCAAFKMVALWRALLQSDEGDYVLWSDSSRYSSNVTLLPGLVGGAVDMLRGAATASAPNRTSLRVAPRWQASPWFAERARKGDWELRSSRDAYGLLTCSGWDCETECATADRLESPMPLRRH